MKKLLTLSVLFCILISGCSETSKVQSPPWEKSQIESFETDEINSVPFLVFKF
jgi:hypothetical protein